MLDETLNDCWLQVEKAETGYVQFLPFVDDMDGFFYCADAAQGGYVMEKKDLRVMDLAEMTALLQQLKQPAFRAKQVFNWVHQKQVQQISQMHNLGKQVLEQLEQQCQLTVCNLERKQVSRDGTEKFLLALADGEYIECVLMRYRGDQSKQRNTLCISSQVGCAMGCTFCATGQGRLCAQFNRRRDCQSGLCSQSQLSGGRRRAAGGQRGLYGHGRAVAQFGQCVESN